MMFFFFFSSRRRHTRWTGDWSSDVCSSDLLAEPARPEDDEQHAQGEQDPAAAEEADREPAEVGDLRAEVDVGGDGLAAVRVHDDERPVALLHLHADALGAGA